MDEVIKGVEKVVEDTSAWLDLAKVIIGALLGGGGLALLNAWLGKRKDDRTWQADQYRDLIQERDKLLGAAIEREQAALRRLAKAYELIDKMKARGIEREEELIALRSELWKRDQGDAS